MTTDETIERRKKQLRLMIQSITMERKNLLNEQRKYKIELKEIKERELPKEG